MSALKADWRRLKRGKQGHRFQDLYDARRQHKGGGASKILSIALGVLLVAAGPVAGLVPGPGGIVVFLLGLGLLARDVRFIARALDWCEPRLRRAWARTKKVWTRSTALTRVALCLLALTVIAGGGYLGYSWMAAHS